MHRMIVAKFGGSSVANAERIRNVANILLQNPDRRVVVVSAPGAIDGRRKVTDALIALGTRYKEAGSFGSEITEIEERFHWIRIELGIPERAHPRIRALIMERLQLAKEQGRIDPIVACGEKLNAMLIAEYLGRLGRIVCCIDPTEFMIAQETPFGKILVDRVTYPRIRAAIANALETHEFIIIPGFYAATLSGDIRLFPRGGSDYTAAVIAAATNAALHENFTDIDGIRAVDPRIVPDAARITNMTLRELAELTLGGSFGVFQAEAVGPLARAGIPIHLRNSFDLSGEGTMVLPSAETESGRAITGIAYRGNYTRISILEYDMGERLGVLARIAEIAAKHGRSIEHMPTTKIMAEIVIGSAEPAEDAALAHEMEQTISADAMRISRDIGLVSLVGQGLERTVGLGGVILGTIAREGINIVFVEFTGMNFTIGVQNGDAQKAVRALYAKFFGKTTP